MNRFLIVIPLALSLISVKSMREQDVINEESYRMLTFLNLFAMLGGLMI